MHTQIEVPDTKYVIKSYVPGDIKINEESYRNTVLIYKEKLIVDATIKHIDDLDAELIEKLCKEHSPKILLLGTGKTQIFPQNSVLAPVYKQHIGLEIMSTESACKTFNILMSDYRDVLALLIV
ncbi:MAG: hypothetical protein JKY19_00130 [Alcanivoracaceae bacterium]|nr:hypothetical protein [Alcanivoracaceae bacterium]